jgi:HSP20 family protein
MKKSTQEVYGSDQVSNTCQADPRQEVNFEMEYSRKPRADVIEREDAYELYLDMPGVEQEHLEIVYDQGELTVRGRVLAVHAGQEMLYCERPAGSYSRSFSVAEGIDPDKIMASLEHGVVMIELGKTADVLPRRIEVQGR